MLPTYINQTAASGMKPLLVRAADKISKHAADCTALGRTFMPFSGDTGGGIGPPAFIDWLKGVYGAFGLRLLSDGCERTAATFALDRLLADLLAALVRDNYVMIERRTTRDN